jgi:DNA (cytosine-5)-methyltransferase 1
LDNQHIDAGAGLFVAISPPLMSGSSHKAAHNARSGHEKDACLIPVSVDCYNGSLSEVGQTIAKIGGTHGLPHALHGVGVRRLTPRECERLQGFPDDFTAIEFRGKPAADGPRYRALGNSMAVPVMHWIGKRIALLASL